MNGLTFFQILGFIGAFLVVISAVGTWHFSEVNDNKKQLKLDELRNQNFLMMRAIENSGQAKWNRNKEGDITGLVVDLNANVKSISSASGSLSSKIGNDSKN